jgi:chemotaxis protein histidine kinase CheA
MTDKPSSGTVLPTRRSPGHRGADIRDTVAEMAERAALISMEAGSRMASAMKEVITAAAGLAEFSVESARDLVQYMVRRGQMMQDEADKLIAQVEEAAAKRKPKVVAAAKAIAAVVAPEKPASKPAPHPPKAAAAPAPKPAAKKAAAPAKAAAKKPVVKAKPAAKVKPAVKAKPAAKSAAKKPAPKAKKK